MPAVLNKPDIVDHISQYVDLRKTGQNWKGLCPFHTEKTPSLSVNPAKQIFKCFGCGAGGDVISFAIQYHDLSFPDALAYLGIDISREYIPNPREERKKALVRQYQQWKTDYTDFLCNVLRMLDLKKSKAKTMSEVESMAYCYHMEQIWEQHFDILYNGNEKDKFELYKELKHGKRI